MNATLIRFEALYALIDQVKLAETVEHFLERRLAARPETPTYEALTKARFDAASEASEDIMMSFAPDLYANLLMDGADFIRFVAYKEARKYAAAFFAKDLQERMLSTDEINRECRCNPRRSDPHFEIVIEGGKPKPVLVSYSAAAIESYHESIFSPEPISGTL